MAARAAAQYFTAAYEMRDQEAKEAEQENKRPEARLANMNVFVDHDAAAQAAQDAATAEIDLRRATLAGWSRPQRRPARHLHGPHQALEPRVMPPRRAAPRSRSSNRSRSSSRRPVLLNIMGGPGVGKSHLIRTVTNWATTVAATRTPRALCSWPTRATLRRTSAASRATARCTRDQDIGRMTGRRASCASACRRRLSCSSTRCR
jgi:ATPase subunit of ABC transporter with duplicated ATPase domains